MLDCLFGRRPPCRGARRPADALPWDRLDLPNCQRLAIPSALVVLSPHQARALPDVREITSARVSSILPDPAAVAIVRDFFQSRAFEVGEAFGNSFSITGPASVFRSTFGPGDHLPRYDGGGDVPGRQEVAELPLDLLPSHVASSIQAVVVTPPPELHPNPPVVDT